MLRTQFTEDLKASMFDKDKVATGTLRLIITAMKDRDIALRAKGNTDGLGEDEIISMLQTMVKQRRDSVTMYTKGGRDELAAQENAEIVIIEKYLPKQMDDDEVKSAIDTAVSDANATGLKDMGKIMGILKSTYNGQMDFGKASGLLKEKLASLG